MERLLSQREFDTWREGDNIFKGEMREFIAAQVQLNLSNERRFSKAEEKQEAGERRIVFVTSIISSIVGAIGGFFGAKM